MQIKHVTAQPVRKSALQMEAKVAKVASVDASLGIVFGYGIVCYERDPVTKKHEPYFDLQDEHIPEHEMLKAVVNYMKAGAPLDAMHDEQKVGKVWPIPLTRDVAKSYGIHDADKYGMMVAVIPDTPEVLAKFVSGEWTGFSIGGMARAKAYVEGTCTECGATVTCKHREGG